MGRDFVVMVPLVIPGEKVKVRVFRNFKNYSEADLIEVIEGRDDIRIEPQCEYFSSCGGCQYQHMSINAQRNWKRQQVSELMQRIGGLNVSEENQSPEESNESFKVNPTIGTE